MLDAAAASSAEPGSLPEMRRCLVLALALFAVSCGGSPPTGPAPDPDELVTGAIAAMRAVPSAHFEMSRSGAVVTIEGLAFDRAIGRYAAPASAEAVLQMHAGDLAVELGTKSIGDQTWLTNPLTGRWGELSGGFNPAVLFDPIEGWAALLADLREVSLVRAGGATHQLSGTVPAARIEALTAGLAEAQEVSLLLWLDAATLEITRLEFSTEGAEGRSDWVITMTDFGKPVEIEPPAEG